MRALLCTVSMFSFACGQRPVEPLPGCGAEPGLILSEDFEVPTLEGLTGPTRWTQGFIQNGGALELAVDPLTSSNRALRAFGPTGTAALVKANLQKKGLCFSSGDIVRVSARHFLASGFSLAEVFLVDLECEACGSENPGPRLQLKEDTGRPRFDRGKLGLSNVGLANDGLPRDRWFTLTVEVTVGDASSGRMRVLVDEAVVIDERGQSAPAELRLDNVQVALTASASPDPVSVFVDDVRIERAR